MRFHVSLPGVVCAMSLGLLLAGCAPRIVVRPASDEDRADKPGVYYTLPKTRIESTFQVKKVTFVPGLFEADATELAEFPFLASKKPDSASWKVDRCPKDLAGKPMVRFELESASVASVGVPDADHVYMVQLDASYFRDQDITLKLTPDGIPTAASLSVTDNRVDLGIALAADIARIIALGAGKVPKGETEKKKFRKEALDELREIASNRRSLIHNGSTNGSVAERLKALADREAELALLWTGKVDEKLAEAKLMHIPAKATMAPPGESELHLFAPCAGLVEKKPDDIEHAWPIFHQFTADALSDAVLAKVIATDRLSQDVTDEKNKDGHGLVYRMPRAVQYSIKLEEGTDKKRRDLASSRILVAQFGPVLYLPTRVGGKSTTTGLEFNPDTGGIMVLTAKGTGANATPAQQALSDIVKRDDEVAKLERKHKILDLKKKIQDLENPPAPPTTP